MPRSLFLVAFVATLGAAVAASHSGTAVGDREAAIADASPPPGTSVTVPVRLDGPALATGQTVFRVGQTYRFDVENGGRSPALLAIEAGDQPGQPLVDDDRAAETGRILPGHEQQLVWNFTGPGTYWLTSAAAPTPVAGAQRSIVVTN